MEPPPTHLPRPLPPLALYPLSLLFCWLLFCSLPIVSLMLVACGGGEVSPPPAGAPTVVLLHGLGRTSRSMEPLERALGEAGYRTVNLDYPSREKTPEELVEGLRGQLATCCGSDPRPVDFVTHSLGGILVRLLAEEPDRLPVTIGRVVMLSPPNKGSEVVDALGETELFEAVMGPAGEALGTGEDSLPNRLGPVPFEVGVITGNASIEPYLSWLIPGEDDGKVAVERAKVRGMTDFLVVPESHTFIMAAPEVAEQVVRFLREGRFDHTDSSTPPSR